MALQHCPQTHQSATQLFRARVEPGHYLLPYTMATWLYCEVGTTRYSSPTDVPCKQASKQAFFPQ